MSSTPTHNLKTIQAAVKAQGMNAFTTTAIACGQNELGMTAQDMIDMIMARTDTVCYKTMPSTTHPGQMQDVYRWPAPFGQMAYVKFCLGAQGKVVVSFKEL